jgi:eukaryotic-like serine/threonine-protein kinase
MAERSSVDARVRSDLGLPERYEPLRHIATGGMASVWCARDQALGRSVAIKLLAERFAYDEDASERFMREARAAARLSGHPNVVMIYDVGETDALGDKPARAFIVMEYLAGGTVADALRVDSVRRVHAVKWVHEAASALDYAHGRGVLHRDIKPANLLLNRDRVLRVGDFGIARLGTEDTMTASGQVIGTASYLAPERALGRPATDASDRYSLAVAAYELLVGERPFTASHFAAQARQHVEDEPPPASSRNRTLPRGVDAVLARGMAKRPEERWSTAQDFARALETALTEPATRPLRAAARAGQAARRARRPAPVAASFAASTGTFAASTPRATRSTAPRPPASAPHERAPRRHRARIPALAALAAGAVVAVAAAGTLGGGGSSPSRSSASASRSVAAKVTHTTPPAHTRSAPVRHPRNTVTATPAAATTPPPASDTLEARGHQLMANGDYSAAIPVLRQAVAAAPHGSLTYGYALYDLGRSLRLAGDPADAVKVLYQRLQIPNQTEVVRQQLQLALLALGQQTHQSGGAGSAGGPAPRPGGTPAPGPGAGPPPGPGGARDHGHGGHRSPGPPVGLQRAAITPPPLKHGPPQSD